MVIYARHKLVYHLVAVVPGVKLFLSGVVVDAAVAGVALREEHHGTLIAADRVVQRRGMENQMMTITSVANVDSKDLVSIFLLFTHADS